MMKIRKAVSIILQYQNEIFYIKRQNFLKAFPGYTAFPGGKVDLTDKGESLDQTLMNALLREVKEELGVNLSALLDDKNNSIVKIAKATSPSFNPLRFETYFYLVNLKEKVIFDVDENEAAEYGWKKPEDIIDEFSSGKRLIVPPVRKVIETLVSNKVPRYLDFDLTRKRTIPQVESLKNIVQMMPLSNTIFPATRTNAFVIGDIEKILIDPSPKNKFELEHLIKELVEFNLTKIFITHHHKDHHQYATNIALKLNLPIYISQDSFDRIGKIYGVEYFENVKVNFLKDGDELGTWLGKKLFIHEIPGHDEGHLGLAPESLEWFLVGDLFQGVGTVVVGGDEGDMSKYMDSLRKVISLAPNCVIPSHGIALGGTNILEKTLEHRELREIQVLELSKQGHKIDEILDIIYFDIPDSVVKYAKANIESHIEKLIKEKRM